MIAPAACGGDDDDDGDDGGDVDAGDDDGGEPDAGEPDAGEPDAGGDDAGTIEGPQYLLGVLLPDTPLGGDGLIRLIATIAVSEDQTSAEFSLQPIFSANCPKQHKGMPGTPTGDALTTEEPVPIEKGAFSLTFAAVPIVDGTLGVADGTAGCEIGLTLESLEVTGDVIETKAGAIFCGTVAATVAGLGTLEGEFGTVPIDEGTVGEDLPKEETTCPAK